MASAVEAYPALGVGLTLDIRRIERDKAAISAILPICKEIWRRKNHPFYQYTPDSHPERNQLGFHQSRAVIRFAGGGNQSGKSRSTAQEIAWILTESHPYQPTPRAAKIYCISASYRTIQEGVWRHLKQILPEWTIQKIGPPVPQFAIPSFILMRNGSKIDFISGEGQEAARQKVQAAEIDFAVIDEEIDGVIWTELIARRLARGGRVLIAATLVRSEPWCLDLEDRAAAGDPSIAWFRFSTYRARDVGHVKAETVREMELACSESDRQVRLEGKSRRSEGLIYPEFEPNVHVVAPFPIPKDWTRYMAVDPGWRNCAGLWAAVGPDGTYVLYREFLYQGAKWGEIGDAIRAAEGYVRDSKDPQRWIPGENVEDMAARWIDPHGFGMNEGGQAKLGNLLNGEPYNFEFCPSECDVLAGVELCRRDLGRGIDGRPRVQVFSTCTRFIREIRSYRWKKDADEGKPEASDKPHKRDDHLMDCWRYLALQGLFHEKLGHRQESLRAELELAGLPIATGEDRAIREHMEDLLKRQNEGPRAPAHPGGLGTEW